jgi:hypothetical protein
MPAHIPSLSAMHQLTSPFPIDGRDPAKALR